MLKVGENTQKKKGERKEKGNRKKTKITVITISNNDNKKGIYNLSTNQ